MNFSIREVYNSIKMKREMMFHNLNFLKKIFRKRRVKPNLSGRTKRNKRRRNGMDEEYDKERKNTFRNSW